MNKAVSELQSNLTVRPVANSDGQGGTFYVSGDVKKVTNWAAYQSDNTPGWFIALDWEYVGGTLKAYSALVPGGRELTGGNGTYVVQIAGANGVIYTNYPYMVTASGATWKFDFSDVNILGAEDAAAAALDLTGELEIPSFEEE